MKLNTILHKITQNYTKLHTTHKITQKCDPDFHFVYNFYFHYIDLPQ